MAKYMLTLKEAKIAQYTMIAMIVIFVIMLFATIGLSANGDSKNATIVGSSSIVPFVIAGGLLYLIWQSIIHDLSNTSKYSQSSRSSAVIPGRTPQTQSSDWTKSAEKMNGTQVMNNTRQ
jgi:hypothetical protein